MIRGRAVCVDPEGRHSSVGVLMVQDLRVDPLLPAELGITLTEVDKVIWRSRMREGTVK